MRASREVIEAEREAREARSERVERSAEEMTIRFDVEGVVCGAMNLITCSRERYVSFRGPGFRLRRFVSRKHTHFAVEPAPPLAAKVGR